MNEVIKIEELSKKYLINHERSKGYIALRDVITDKFKNFGKRINYPDIEEFWALKNINLTIQQGDRVGIIGHNGAGKSTLLKILSRITEPTTGRITLKGRLASLLEVGTGFHPELTGRENIYLNGAILGMSKKEISKKFDEIVAFSEVEKFLDTPVKRYSSGMYVRLAFAVAAHLEPEILIIDEVLAVGDAKFQKKCLGKMDEVGRSGRTVIFVSHNMTAVSKLCNKAVLLSQGQVIGKGEPEEIITYYLSENNNHNENILINRRDRQGEGNIRIRNIFLRSSEGRKLVSIKANEPFEFVIFLEVNQKFLNKPISLILVLVDNKGYRIASFLSETSENQLLLGEENQVLVCRLPDGLPLLPGTYGLHCVLFIGGVKQDKLLDAFEFEVLTNKDINVSLVWEPGVIGSVYIRNYWHSEKLFLEEINL